MQKISTIIPVYNAEKFIAKCLDSILSQTFSDIEIICVDDGSTDSSLRILFDYEEKDSRIKVLSQKNQYAGVARNNGMSVATGEYLFFMDADDSLLDANVFSQIVVDIENHGKPQIIRFRAKAYDMVCQQVCSKSTLEMKNIPDFFFENVFTPKKDDNIQVIKKIEPAPWLGMIRRDFVIKNRLQFNNQKCHNDSSFMWCSFAVADTVIFSKIYCTLYKTNDSNSLQGKRANSYNAIIGNIDCIREFCTERNLDSRIANYIILREIRNLIRACESDVVFRNNGYNNLKITFEYIGTLPASIFEEIDEKEDYEYSAFIFIQNKKKFTFFVYFVFFIRTFLKFAIRKIKIKEQQERWLK